MSENTAMPEDLKNSEEQRNRLWEHLLHVETQIYARMTLFLVIETLLLATVGTIYSKPAPSLLVVKAIVFLGLCITIIWLALLKEEYRNDNCSGKSLRLAEIDRSRT